MKKRPYDFLGFAGAFIVLAAVVALWAGSQARGGLQSGGSETDSAPAANSNSQNTASSEAISSQPQEMGQTNLQKGTGTLPNTSAVAGATTIAWQDSYESAVQRARTEGKPLMVDFYTDWCGYCKKLDAEVYSKPDIIATSGQFVCVKVNAEKRRDLAGAYGVTGYPTVAFVRVSEKGNTPLQLLPGYVDAPQFAQLLAHVQTQYQQAGASNA